MRERDGRLELLGVVLAGAPLLLAAGSRGAVPWWGAAVGVLSFGVGVVLLVTGGVLKR